ncbi:MAG TPA: hypothetical protein VF572_05295 [Candidatus Saccharimonadales bacterium]|jgi:hypothetical protein
MGKENISPGIGIDPEDTDWLDETVDPPRAKRAPRLTYFKGVLDVADGSSAAFDDLDITELGDSDILAARRRAAADNSLPIPDGGFPMTSNDDYDLPVEER